MGEDDEVVQTADELEREKRLEVAMEEEQIVPTSCSSSAELIIRLKRRCRSLEA